MKTLDASTYDQPLVSMIVASYNVADFLEECLNSILSQSYENWEAIIVDDGSTDSSADIAQRFCNADKRFRLITQSNQGVSVVRNQGIADAKGEYIYFIDGDDCIMEDCIDYCTKEIGEADMLACDCLSITKTGNPIQQTSQGDSRIQTGNETVRQILDRKLLTSVWSKFYRRTFIGSLRFNPILRGGQDMYFNCELMLTHPDSIIKVSNHPIYKYRILRDSVSHARGKGRRMKLLSQIFETDKLYHKYRRQIDDICINEFTQHIIGDILYHYKIQGLWKHTDRRLLPLLIIWRTRFTDHNNDMYLRTRYVGRGNQCLSDFLVTLRYLPSEIKRIVKTHLFSRS